MNQHEREPQLWGLGAVAIVLRWLEELLSLLNGPLLMFGAGIAVVDLLTDGQLTASNLTLLYAWAISQAVGIDTQLLGCFARARHVLRHGRWWAMLGWLTLGALLCYAAWQAGYVFAVQTAEHITEAAALAQLGMPAPVWLGERAALAVGLVALSGWTRYHPPAKHEAEDAAAERARLEREAELEPLRQRVRAQKALGAVGLGRQLMAAAQGKDASTPPALPSRPPTGPGSPALAPDASKRTAAASATREPVLRLEPPPEWRTAKPRKRTASAKERVYRVLDAQPNVSTRQLAKLAKASDSTVSKYRALYRRDHGIGEDTSAGQAVAQ